MSAPLDHFRYSGKELSIEGVPLSRIASEVGTPAYVYGAKALLAPLLELQRGLRSADALICFAMKSNSSLSVVQLLGQAGAGMDLVSGGELYRALRAGVSADRIVFSGVGKTREEMRQALEAEKGRGIFSFNVESEAELRTLSDVAAGLRRKAPVALRFNPDVDPKTHPYISTGLRQNKFGIQKKEILRIARRTGDYPGIRFHGLSIHIGSLLLSLAPLRDAFSKTRELLDELAPILPEPLSMVDLGGGLGVAYHSGLFSKRIEKTPSIPDYCRLILQVFGPRSGLSHPLKITIEPGRRIAANAGALLTRVLYRKPRGKKDFLIVDAGMNDLLRPALYGSHHEIVPVVKTRGSTVPTDIVGPVCESSDCFAQGRALPRSLVPDDLLAILSAGAYGFTMASSYNSRPRPPEVLVEDGKFRVIRARETHEDLVRGENLR